jgi:hypothetical protein
MTNKLFIIFLTVGLLIINSCSKTKSYKLDLQSGDLFKINEACYYLGEAKDTSAVRLLLTHIKDPRISTHIKYKGMCGCYSRLCAIKKISGLNYPNINQFDIDTAAINFYMDWAIKKGYIKDTADIKLDP